MLSSAWMNLGHPLLAPHRKDIVDLRGRDARNLAEMIQIVTGDASFTNVASVHATRTKVQV